VNACCRTADNQQLITLLRHDRHTILYPLHLIEEIAAGLGLRTPP
jgi:hypothetical protein